MAGYLMLYAAAMQASRAGRPGLHALLRLNNELSNECEAGYLTSLAVCFVLRFGRHLLAFHPAARTPHVLLAPCLQRALDACRSHTRL